MIYAANFPPQIDSQLKLSDGLFLDLSGKGNTITNNGATLTTDHRGRANKAFNFDGVNDKVILPNTLYRNKTKLTIIASINVANSANRFVILDAYASLTDAMQLYIFQSRLWWTNRQSNGLEYGSSAENSIPSGITHIVAMFDSGKMFCSFNGGAITELSYAAAIPTSLNNSDLSLEIGYFKRETVFTAGVLIDMSFIDRVLSQSEITQLYNEWRK